MKKTVVIMLIIAMSLMTYGCFTQNHVVGKGAQTAQVEEAKQWYALWGLVPINTVDTKLMSGGSQDYTITTSHSFVDGLIGIFTGLVTIYPKTVEVKK